MSPRPRGAGIGVTHYLYEGQVLFEVDDNDGSATVVLADGEHDLGDELASKLAFLFGADADAAKLAGSRRLRILIEDLDERRPAESHRLDGDGIDTELVRLLRAVRALPYGAELLQRARKDWQYVCWQAIEQLRTAHLLATACEIALANKPAEREHAAVHRADGAAHAVHVRPDDRGLVLPQGSWPLDTHHPTPASHPCVGGCGRPVRCRGGAGCPGITLTASGPVPIGMACSSACAPRTGPGSEQGGDTDA